MLGAATTSPPFKRRRFISRQSLRYKALGLFTVAALLAIAIAPAQMETALAATAACGNATACENELPGTPAGNWDVSGNGDASIQGYATSMSVNVGQTQTFKILTPARSYRIDILRLGYYQGNGARTIVSGMLPTATLPQSQPACLTFSATGLIDCGNWSASASWAVPADAVSGVYIAHLVRTDTGGASNIPFVVRNDASTNAVVFQTSDTTWQAYNSYGGNSLYTCSVACPPGEPRSYKAAFAVSYNRPFSPGSQGPNQLMDAEYPMIRFLEANGYDLTYQSGLDTSIRGDLLRNHRVFVSTGHDEYWSGPQRSNVEAARNAGVNLAFFSGNEIFWKTRWEPSYAGTSTANRTLVSYEDTQFDAPTDPVTWTGTWRDPRFGTATGGGNPENALTGQYFRVNSGSADIRVPAAYASMRIWRNTAAATLTGTQSLTLGSGLNTLGYEWDVDSDNGFRPAGLFKLSSTTVSVPEAFSDYGSTVAPATLTHNLTMYRADSGALVFGAGTIQWSYGLDGYTTRRPADVNMQQATINIFADMGAQPASLQSGLTAATPSTDKTAPTSRITSGLNGQTIADGTSLTISGTASDTGGGVVAGVEISTDSGTTWHPTTGTANWSYTWIVHGSPTTTVQTRAVDDSGNKETPAAGASVSVPCPCSIWGTNVVPSTVDSGDPGSVELGLKFTSTTAGQVTGVRFYKAAANTGTHSGSLWSASGTRLATAIFSGESASGWQTVTFASPVAILANTVYVVSYFAPSGRYSQTNGYLYPNPAPIPAGGWVDSPPLQAPRSLPGAPNGMYSYGSTSSFPTSTFRAQNYWVDVVFTTGVSTPTPPTVVSTTPTSGATAVSPTAALTATLNQSVTASTVAFALTRTGGSAVTGTTTYTAGTNTTTFTPSAALTNATSYTATVSGATNTAGQAMSPYSWTFTTAAATVPPTCPCTVFASTSTPTTITANDSSAVVLGMKFRSDVAGTVTGIRFYKGSKNTGTHTGTLWSATGTQLSTVTFTGETASGWQQATLATPVAINANTTYVVSYYAPNGFYSADSNYFTSAADSPPLHGLASGTDGPNGLYRYGTGGFPTSSYQNSNYWVDVVFTTG
ncbi:DUF4082 domain-containing protein [Cryobacterium sp. CG_9.6]|uniref:DUF4082 domain-containing protein n=1 Tax=Cryobacterium sp. CG_9.6 TaxID=2760710 RepID=UPI00247567CB|nr:DUF4082 domain-containing protein [Cryobacterium sp. CG_9.6]MDH6237584.1 hypothetical protein [Cryobacterium sp. CG_9.6]